MSMNKQRRHMIKATAAIAASSVMLLAAPSMVAAACSSSEHAALNNSNLPGGLRVELTRKGRQAYVTVTNTLTTPVTLTHVYPGIVSDQSGSFDLNSLLVTGPKTVIPGKPWISKIGKAHIASLSAPTSPKITQGVKITVATHNATADGYKLVETTRTLLVS
ncbi:MAG: hypothetical protein V3U65_17395 [Granulosicoccaceae bacterium]